VRGLAVDLDHEQMREIRSLKKRQEIACSRGLDAFPVEREELVPRGHDMHDTDILVTAVVRGLQELNGALTLDVIGGHQPHQALLLGDEQRTHSKANHVGEPIVDLTLRLDRHRVVALEIGEGVNRGIAGLEPLTVENRAARQYRITESPHRE